MKKQNTFYKILATLVVIVAAFTPSMLFGQSTTAPPLPCVGTDDYSNCPLDTWVMALAFLAFVFAVLHLNRKQKRAVIAK